MAKVNSTTEDAVVRREEELQEERDAIATREAKRKEFEDSKVDWRNKIGADVDTSRSQADADFFGTEAEVYGEPEEVEEEEETVDVETPEVEEPEVEDDETDGQLLVTKTVKGKKVTKTVDEWIALATKVEDADSYYDTAAKKFHESRKEPVKKTSNRDLAKKIQTGTEEEAEEALNEIQQNASETVKKEQEQADRQMRGKEIYMKFQTDYADIVNDPVLNGALNSMDNSLLEKQFDTDEFKNFDKRLRHCGEEIRKWRDRIADTSVKKEKRQALVSKKEKMMNLSTASQKQTKNEDKPLSEKAAKDQAVQNMFAARKKKSY